ncbi:MAG: DUF1622 domain-containing protein [Gaiellales bacterium]|nr:MAG: DUF1622 domain-containing protein [Gaiellales bacterium]
MDFSEVMEGTGKVIDVIGVAVIVIGVLAALAVYAARLPSAVDRLRLYQSGRKSIGRAILLGLEFLIAGDIIRTVATTPSFQSVGILGMIIVIRAFLSMTLEFETEGRWPWAVRPGAQAGEGE